jgi:Ca2+-binding RTX toxin-like protein
MEVSHLKAITKDTRFFRGIMAAALFASLLVVAAAGPAQANHGSRTLDVPEEFQEHFTGEPATFTATLSSTNTETSPINIDFEHEAGANNTDGNTPNSPDLTCDVPVGAVSCSVSYTGTRATGNTPDRWRIWIDHDKIQTTVEADPDENVTANRADCEQDPRRSNCGPSSYGTGPTGTVQVPYQPGTGSSQCSGQNASPTLEPDCTDVVQVAYNNRPSEATGLDCDDRSGSQRQDTERETNPSSTDDSVSGERYRCRVTNQFGEGMNRLQVYAEVENGVNDPDPVDGASYESPDYNCETTSDEDGIPFFADSGVCFITVLQVEGETGTAEVCFWTGLPEDGPKTTHCGDEPTGEAQSPDGSDAANDLADQVEKTWQNVSTFTADCEPETDINPAGQRHEIRCFARSGGTTSVSGVQMRMEIQGAGDPDQTDSPQTPDQSCVTGPDGSCTFNHTSTTAGNTTYRVWIDDGTPEPRDDGTDRDVDRTEGQNESTAAGELPEPDSTDVVSKKWGAAPTTLQMTPDSDTASVGECNPYTITLSSGSGTSTAPAEGAVIDVEQLHALAGNNTASDEPTVDFCVPASGPNPSDVDTSRGDLGPESAQENDRESPDNKGTAGGETVKGTDANGQITIGITSTAGQGSDGSGTVTITAFFDSNNNDDPDGSEPKDTSTKTWQDASAADARTIDCQPATVTQQTGEPQVVTCTVKNRAGQGVQGETVNFTTSGVGTISPSTATTDSQGRASTTATSSEEGSQTVTGTLADSTAGEPDTDECERAANDPQGAPAGSCSDSSTITWQAGPVGPECSDGIDNDGDEEIDFPNDPGCENAQDDSESPDPERTCPGFEGDSRNQIVGTEGDDTLTGTEGDDIICGLGGNDLILGEGGNDFILGGDGNDSLRGGDGDDVIHGDAGKDELRGNDGNDELRGGDQNDDLRGNAGDDLMLGQSGFDVLRGGGGDDVGRGGSGNDTLQGFTGKDLLVGNAGNDTIKGGGGADELRGGKNDDVISGGKGPDRIRGGSGRDVCAGGRGNNNVTGCEA